MVGHSVSTTFREVFLSYSAPYHNERPPFLKAGYAPDYKLILTLILALPNKKSIKNSNFNKFTY